MQPMVDEPRRVAPSRGMGWLLQSVALLRLQPGRLLLIALLMQLVLGLTQLPLLGLLVVLAVPGLSAGVLEALHVTACGRRPELRMMFLPLASRPHSARLLALGGLIFAIGVLTMSLLLSGSETLMDPAMIERLEQGDLDAVTSLDQQALAEMALAFLIGIAVSGTLSFFAIPLIWFRSYRLGPALLVGLRALVINWLPFLLLGLGLGLVLMPLAVVTGVLIGLAAQGGLVTVFSMGLVVVLLLLFQLLMFATQYCAFRDIFGAPPEAAGMPDNQDQLVA